MFLVANSISLEFRKRKYLSICSKWVATKAPGFVSLFLTSILCWYWQSYAFSCHSKSWWLCRCDVKPLEVVDPQPVFTIVSGMCVSCRVKGHSEYLLCFFFLSGTGTAHLHSTNILPVALRVRNMLLVCFQLETHSHLLEILIASLKARDTQPFTALLCRGSTYSWVTAKPKSFTELTAFSEKPKYCKISSSSAYLL